MIAAGEKFSGCIRKYVKELAFPVPAAKAQLRYALLGRDAGFIGAAGCARLWLSKRPNSERGVAAGASCNLELFRVVQRLMPKREKSQESALRRLDCVVSGGYHLG